MSHRKKKKKRKVYERRKFIVFDIPRDVFENVSSPDRNVVISRLRPALVEENFGSAWLTSRHRREILVRILVRTI